jgi:hypothetical protein
MGDYALEVSGPISRLRQAGQRHASAPSGIGRNGSFVHQHSAPGWQTNALPHLVQWTVSAVGSFIRRVYVSAACG